MGGSQALTKPGSGQSQPSVNEVPSTERQERGRLGRAQPERHEPEGEGGQHCPAPTSSTQRWGSRAGMDGSSQLVHLGEVVVVGRRQGLVGRLQQLLRALQRFGTRRQLSLKDTELQCVVGAGSGGAGQALTCSS